MEFLEYVSKNYEIIVFCNGSPLYCSSALDYIERHQKYFAHRLYNDHVMFENSAFSVKYYDFLFDDHRTLQSTVIVETHVATYSLLMNSGVPIAAYNPGNLMDKELVRLAGFLDRLLAEDSIPSYIGGKVRQAVL